MEDVERREAAISRLKQKREFWNHLFVYVMVNALLVFIWAMSNSGGYFWPMWAMAGWGIGLVMHAFETFRRPIHEDAILREMDRLPR